MGHRKSHSRASKRETPEGLSTHSKDLNEGGSQEKRERNRKKEHEDVSKKRHKERHKGKNHHHHSSKSVTREKPKGKASRRKDGRNMSLESDSSTSFLSSREARHRHGRHSHSRSAVIPRKRSRSCSSDAHKEHRIKKSKENSEAFNMENSRKSYDASNDPKRVKKDGMQRHEDTQLVQEKDSADEGAFSSELRCRVPMRNDGCVTTISKEQEKGLDGKTDKVLEVELRQKALANFLRHQDTSYKMDEHMGRISPTSYGGTTRPVSYTNEQNEQAVTEVDSRQTMAVLGNSLNVDASIDGHQCASYTVASVNQKGSLDGSGLACDSRSNLEEGEISDTVNENETGNEIVSSLVDKGKGLLEIESNEKEGPDAGGDICEVGHKSSLSGKVERASVAAESVNENQAALSEAHAVEGALNGNPGTAQPDSSNAFEQKTMSVMRGGEMVQVNYKVYIPKRAAELARRRLHR